MESERSLQGKEVSKNNVGQENNLEGIFTKQGLFKDATNIWAPIAIDLKTLKILKGSPKEGSEDIIARLSTPRKTYEEYLSNLYSESDTEGIIKHADSVVVKEHDALVEQYNNLISKGTLTEESARDLMEKAFQLFRG